MCEIRERMRAAGAIGDSEEAEAVALVHVLLFQTASGWHELVNAPQGDDEEARQEALTCLNMVLAAVEGLACSSEETRPAAKEALAAVVLAAGAVVAEVEEKPGAGQGTVWWIKRELEVQKRASSGFYTRHQQALQTQFNCRPLADRLTKAIIHEELNERDVGFITSRDYFYLSTVNGQGEPTVSYKGGGVGVVTVVDSKTLAFPIYDGNGMFLSAGNMADTGKVGLLFMDFETPMRVRAQGTATIFAEDDLLPSYPGAMLIARIAVTAVFPNCARYIHKHKRVETSPYVPDKSGKQPLPAWKRICFMQDVMHKAVQERVEREGGVLTMEQYGEKLMTGQS